MLLNGGFPPSTAGNPRPYDMPPFAHELNDEEVAAVGPISASRGTTRRARFLNRKSLQRKACPWTDGGW